MVNEASWDRFARVVIGVVMLVVGFGLMSGTAGLIVGIVGFVPLVTGLVGWCPLYSLLGFRTNGAHRDAAAN